MREILFRGKRLYNDEWVEGHLITREGAAYICRKLTTWYLFDTDLCLGGYIEVDPSTVGQYTGSTDKNEKKIFEGDIIENIDRAAVVVFDDEKKGFYMRFF